MTPAAAIAHPSDVRPALVPTAFAVPAVES